MAGDVPAPPIWPGESSSESAPLLPQDDHSDVAVSRLIWQYRDKPRIVAMLRLLVDQVQVIEDVCWQLLTQRYLYAVVVSDDLLPNPPAEGAQLDGLGDILGEARGELPDAAYRAFLKVRSLINRCNGQLPEILSILDIIPTSTEAIDVREGYPASILFQVPNPTYPWETWQRLKACIPAGVYAAMIYTPCNFASAFSLSGTYNTLEKSADQGYSSVHAPTTGGKNPGVFAS